MDDRRRQDRRKQLLSVRLPDRRYGFPRRIPQSTMRRRYLESLASIREQSTALVLLASLLLALNIADLALTQRALAAGAIEVNPVMAALFDSSANAASAAKLGLSALVVAGMWALRRYRHAISALVWTCVAMGVLVAYQTFLVLAIA